ncbi:unnamed protein product [Meloidogyne enterolobii]|uniref:Uncharacterized protein n=1 Tax=Meloidogyne enterolobii TaxID=390850 RepID=A0ACB0Z4P8_MELEN
MYIKTGTWHIFKSGRRNLKNAEQNKRQRVRSRNSVEDRRRKKAHPLYVIYSYL